MKSYKVEITQTDTYIVDVQVESVTDAEKKATKEWNKIVEAGIYHYNQTGDTITSLGMVYDVTGTDDDVFQEEKDNYGKASPSSDEYKKNDVMSV